MGEAAPVETYPSIRLSPENTRNLASVAADGYDGDGLTECRNENIGEAGENRHQPTKAPFKRTEPAGDGFAAAARATPINLLLTTVVVISLLVLSQ